MTRVNGRPPVSVMVPALNEERNLAEALASVEWADEVFVIDSNSRDGTREVAEAAGARVVQFEYEPPGPKKMNWGLENLPFSNEWVLILAADERITPQLRYEIEDAILHGDADGYLLDREFVFMGRSLRCMRPNWTLRLFKHRLGRLEDLGLDDLPDTGDIEVHEHVRVRGRVSHLDSAMRHDDYKGIGPWLERHVRYATWEAHFSLQLRSEPLELRPRALLAMDPVERKRALRRVWVRLPGRPFLRFFVWYVFRRGFADGLVGLVYCVLMGWYELVIGLKMREMRAGSAS
jgi:glycosyltransferase involved in cell wall biosynthesis